MGIGSRNSATNIWNERQVRDIAGITPGISYHPVNDVFLASLIIVELLQEYLILVE